MRRYWQGALLGAALCAAVFHAPGGSASGASPSLGPKFRLVGTWPATGATGVLTDSVVLRFNQPLDADTLDDASFQVLLGQQSVPGTVEVGFDPEGTPDPRWAIWTPEEPLLPGATLRVVVSRDLKSQRGRSIEDPFHGTFTTNEDKSPDTFTALPEKLRLAKIPRYGPLPKVRFTFPQGGLGNVYTDDVLVRFNQVMAPDAFENGTFSVLQAGKALAGTITFPDEASGREVLFTPAKALFKDTTFQMVVTREARTLRGRYLREEYRAGFGTSPFKGGVKPLLAADFEDVIASPLPVGRAFHTVTPLASGDLLIAGGQELGGSPTATCYLWNSNSATLTQVASLNTARRKHAAVPSRTGGVLVIGGFGPAGTTLNTVESYDPGTNQWTVLAPLATSRANLTATVVAQSRVLVVGGFTNDSGPLAYAAGAEIYNPFANLWAPTNGPPIGTRGGHTATLMTDGRVLLAGGNEAQVKANEIYSPASGTFAASAPPLEYRSFHAACLTKTGTVLLAAGGPAIAEQYDPNGDTMRDAGACPPIGLPVSTSGLYATLTLIPGGGRIALIGGLVIGGVPGGGDLILDQVQLWDPAEGAGNGAFYPMNFDLKTPRAGHTVTPLPSGNFLIVGGLGTNGFNNETAITLFHPSQ